MSQRLQIQDLKAEVQLLKAKLKRAEEERDSWRKKAQTVETVSGKPAEPLTLRDVARLLAKIEGD